MPLRCAAAPPTTCTPVGQVQPTWVTLLHPSRICCPLAPAFPPPPPHPPRAAPRFLCLRSCYVPRCIAGCSPATTFTASSSECTRWPCFVWLVRCALGRTLCERRSSCPSLMVAYKLVFAQGFEHPPPPPPIHPPTHTPHPHTKNTALNLPANPLPLFSSEIKQREEDNGKSSKLEGVTMA